MAPYRLRMMRAMSTLALPRPLWIRPPEWPPERPRIWMVTGSPSACSQARGRVRSVTWPPALPQQNTPSGPQSRLIRRRERMRPNSRLWAPIRPTSSEAVNTHSSGGCTRLSSVSTAIIQATATPLSAPRVVPLARRMLPSTTSSMGSLVKSWSMPWFFSHTMSVWPCSSRGGRSSQPLEPGFVMYTFSASSR